MSNCMCGGCDRCLKDQGFATDGELAARDEAAMVLTDRIIAIAQQDAPRFSKETDDVCASDTYWEAARERDRADVSGDPEAIIRASLKMRALLIGEYVKENLDRTIGQINNLRAEQDAEARFDMRKAA